MGDNLALLIGPAVLTSLALYVWVAASLQSVFRKAGQEGWQAWVPVLNVIVLLRLGGLSGWWALLLLVPAVGVVALAVVVWIACHRINLSFGVGAGMTVLAIVLFPVWSSVLGWGSARWIGREQSPSAASAITVPGLAGRVGAHGMSDDEIGPRPATSAMPVAAVSSFSAEPAPAGHLDDEASPDDYSAHRRVRMPGSDARDRDDHQAAIPGPAQSAGRSPAPYSGTLPRILGPAPHDAAPGPRRAVVPGSEAEPDELTEPRNPPVHGMPQRPTPSGAARDPWAPRFDHQVQPLRTSRLPHGLDDTGSDSAEVSAVAGAPALGTPMPARSSVSARGAEPEFEAEGPIDDTAIAARRKTAWMLIPPLGAPIPVYSHVLIVGRRPNVDPAFPKAQLVPITDETRTMSKTHARLELNGDGWTIVDLDSTNGVLLLHPDGTEVDLESGRPAPATELFLLGDAEVRLTREPGAG